MQQTNVNPHNINDLPWVVIVTALPIEFTAVTSHLTDLLERVHPKGAVYECGIFRSDGQFWNVAVIETGPGNETAALETERAIDYFNPRFVFFVGIAGGIKDVEIADVIAATKVYGYEFGKAEKELRPRPSAYRAAYRLEQRARAAARKEDWLKRISKLPERNPRALVGAIASGEKVIADSKSEVYVFIKQNYGDALAVDMEGFGVHDAAHRSGKETIIIRGISDLVDEKGDGYHETAALHASAFAFEMLAKLVVSEASLSLHAGVETRDERDTLRFVLGVETTSEMPDKTLLLQMEANLRELSGDSSLSIYRIEKGSLVIFAQSSLNGFERIKSLFDSNKLTLLKEFPITFVHLESEYISLDEIRAALKRTSIDLLSWHVTVGVDRWIDRPEIRRLMTAFETQDSNTIILLGAPGSGKSSLLAKLGKTLEDKGITVLAIKADLLNVSVNSLEQLSKDLGLPDNLVACVERLSRHEKVVVLLDQLDALGDLVDLRTERLNIMLDFIKRLSDKPNVHVLSSCRTFEYNHDARLRSIKADTVTLELPQWDDVAQVLKDMGIDSSSWNPNFKELLKTPLHIKIFLKIAPSFAVTKDLLTYHALLEELWKIKLLNPDGIEGRAELVERIASKMGEEETLWLPISAFDAHMKSLENLISEGILISDNSGIRIAFSHQTIFDFARARAFAKEIESLSNYVVARQSALFVRPQLWSGLHYLRVAHEVTYKKELDRLWTDESLRLHIRLLLIEFLSQLQKPDDYEAGKLLPLLEKPEFRRKVLYFMSGSPGWFERVKNTYLPQIMSEETERAKHAIFILQKAWRFDSDGVFKLIERYWLRDKEKDPLTWATFQELSQWDAKAIEVICTILHRTKFASWAVCDLASIISAASPELAPIVVRYGLAQSIASSEQSLPGIKHQKALDSFDEWYNLPAIAEAAPKVYLDVVWPWLVEMLERDFGDSSVKGTYHHISILSEDLKDGEPDRYPFMTSFKIAIETFAQTDAVAFISFLNKWEKSNISLVQRLLSKGLEKLIENFPQVVFKFIMSDGRRFALGSYDDQHKDSKRLISKLAPLLSQQDLSKLEDAILKWDCFPNEEGDSGQRRADTFKYNRQRRLKVLHAIPRDLMSDKTKRLVEEEERAFPKLSEKEIVFTGFHTIESPMSAEQMAKAKDEDIVKLFEKFVDSTNWDHPKDLSLGGSIQASRAFSDFAKSHPQRAIPILGHFKPGLQERPTGMALEGLSISELPDKELFTLVVELNKRGFKTLEFRAAAAHALSVRVKDSIGLPDYICNILNEWLTQAVEPHKYSSTNHTKEEKEEKEEKVDRSILWGHQSFFVVPQGSFTILEALTKALLFRKPIAADRWIEVLESHLSRNDAVEVWHAMLHFLQYLSNCEHSRAITFLENLFSSYPRLISSNQGAILLTQIQAWIPTDVFMKWLFSLRDGEWVKGPQAYAEISMLYYAWHPENEDVGYEIHRIMQRDYPDQDQVKVQHMRLGLAYTVSRLWSELTYKKIATGMLCELIKDNDDKIDRAIMDIFRIIDHIVPDDLTRKFLDCLIQHPRSFQYAPDTFIVERLRDLLPLEPDRIYDISKILIEQKRSELNNLSTSFAIAAPEIINIALTLQRLGGTHRLQGLELFETLLDIEAYGVSDALNEIDNRSIMQGGSPVRRRRTRKK